MENKGFFTKLYVDASAQYGTTLSMLSKNGSTKKPLNCPVPAVTLKVSIGLQAVITKVLTTRIIKCDH